MVALPRLCGLPKGRRRPSMVLTYDDEPVPAGLVVRYHGNLADMHGTYRITAECDCDRCDEAWDEAWRVAYWSGPPRVRSSTMRIWHKRRYVLTEASGGNVLECVGDASITTTTPPGGFPDLETPADDEQFLTSCLSLRDHLYAVAGQLEEWVEYISGTGLPESVVSPLFITAITVREAAVLATRAAAAFRDNYEDARAIASRGNPAGIVRVMLE
jgi:hypothetical protein